MARLCESRVRAAARAAEADKAFLPDDGRDGLLQGSLFGALGALSGQQGEWSRARFRRRFVESNPGASRRRLTVRPRSTLMANVNSFAASIAPGNARPVARMALSGRIVGFYARRF